MKKLLITVMVIVTFVTILPLQLSAQTSDENWVSLGEYLQDNYKKKGKYLIPKYAGNYQYVSKLAYKSPDNVVILPKSDIIINKVSHVEKHGIPVFEKNDPIVVNELFEVLMNGKPISGYDIKDGDNGWKIIDLNGVGSISSVLMKKKFKNNDNNIFDHIYVTLTPSQDPYKIKAEKIKALAEEKKKIEEIKASQNNNTVIPSLPIGE